MSSIGTGYDLAVTIYSPDGRLYQIEYANKAVENSGTIVGICCKDGVLLGVEKFIENKMEEETTNTRIFNIDRHAGMTVAGWKPDSRPIINKARSEAKEYKDIYGHPIPGKILNERVSGFVHFHTMYMDMRPLGVQTMMATYDQVDGPQLYMIDPSGETWGYKAASAGKHRQGARTELEKLKFDELSVEEGVKEIARIIYQVHDDTKDREMELELSWICEKSHFQHKRVPKHVYDEAMDYAKQNARKSEETVASLGASSSSSTTAEEDETMAD